MPVTTTQIGVSELRMAASELSILLAMASAKRNAGKRLPSMPVDKTQPIFFRGILERWNTANGRKTMPAEKIRNAAICAALISSLLYFITMNELPQIKDSRIKIVQLSSVFCFINKRQRCWILYRIISGNREMMYSLLFFEDGKNQFSRYQHACPGGCR
jgi:hypothetical protein